MNKSSTRDRVVREYADLAGVYDTKWSSYIEASTRETVARLQLRAEDRLLDIGCGTGALLNRLSAIHPAAQLTGIEPVPEMLAVARCKLPPAIELHQGWAQRLPFQDVQFDTVVSCSMFHYIDRPEEALHEIRRVLRPGGQFILTDWCGDYLSCRLLARYLRLLGRAHAEIYRVRDCVRLVEHAGYAIQAVERYRINGLWGLMTARFTRLQ